MQFISCTYILKVMFLHMYAYSLCPVLKTDRTKLKGLLAECLMNRRAYLRRLKRISPKGLVSIVIM